MDLEPAKGITCARVVATSRQSVGFRHIPPTLWRDVATSQAQGRIAAGLSQKELAERLGLKEQQIQRYEATNDASTSLTRVCEFAWSLGLKVKAEAFVTHRC